MLSPMMQHYLETKKEHPDCILFYRLGDFYEMFFDDAKTVSRELELTLTGKECGLEERAPMCGVPFHSANVYIAKLVEKGYKVAVCEQTEDPKLAKGLVKREVVRIITPGTITDSEFLDDKNNNYLCVLYKTVKGTGAAFSDISTGEIYVTQADDNLCVINEIARYEPKEIIVNQPADTAFSQEIMTRFHVTPFVCNDEFFRREGMEEKILSQFKTEKLSQLKLEGKEAAQTALCAMLCYLEHTQKSRVSYMDQLTSYEVNEYMDLDAATRRNLEITETMRDKAKKGSLLWVLDKTVTSMGARKLKQWMEKPLLSAAVINKRLYAVRELFENLMLRDELREVLNGIYDMSRITTRICLKSVTPKDLESLRESLKKLPGLREQLLKTTAPLFCEMVHAFDIMEDVRDLLDRAIVENAPAIVRDGGFINLGFNEELDRLKRAVTEGKDWLKALEAEQRERTGIKNLKVGFNKVFGYYFEVTKSNIKDVPEDYIRKQTLANCERYINPRLKELENEILGSSERILNLELAIYNRLVEKLLGETDRLKAVCEIISVTDAVCALAQSAFENNFTMPEITLDGALEIKDGRHPVVEKMLKNTLFIPNDTILNCGDDRMLIITGPNMAGKSTYMRQVALITLMAQIGSFVPASYAKIGIVDKIFTRVGASDDIAAGQSTFMVEMSEVANILKNATKNSLIILDEIGRGTSTFDGLSIAWAVVEYIQNKKIIGAKTLFATHYHELTQLEDTLPGVKNYNIVVKKRGDDITFLRKIVKGGADDSYGIEVAALAGVPDGVIKRAKKILAGIEKGDMQRPMKENQKEETPVSAQIDFGDGIAQEIKEELQRIDITTYTPIEALNKLYELAQKANEA